MRTVLAFTDASIANKNYYTHKQEGVCGFVFSTISKHDQYIQSWRKEFSVASKPDSDIHTLELVAIGLAMHCISSYEVCRFIVFTDSDAAYEAITLNKRTKVKRFNTILDFAQQYYKRLLDLGFEVSFVLCKSHVNIGEQIHYLINNNDMYFNKALINNVQSGNRLVDEYVSFIAKNGNIKKLEPYIDIDLGNGYKPKVIPS